MAYGDWTQYEWDVEHVSACDTPTLEENEIIDHFHQTSFADCAALAATKPEPGTDWHIALVLDTQDGRAWAYYDTETKSLDEWLCDAYDHKVRRVPQRFHAEVERYLNSSASTSRA